MIFLTHLIVIAPITTIFSNRNPQNLSLCFAKLGNRNKKIRKWQANPQNKATSIIPNKMFSKQDNANKVIEASILKMFQKFHGHHLGLMLTLNIKIN
jgi:hypothetical protein